MTPDPLSPYAAALDGDRGEVHPGLPRYFQTIPTRQVGVGHGVFERIGCRNPVARRVLGPLLHALERRGAVFAGWAEQVPFTVRNRDGAGRTAQRELHLPGGSWIMRDLVRALPNGRIVDRLGAPATLAAVFDVRTASNALELRSTRVGLRFSRVRVRIPRPLAPRIHLREQTDPDGDQRVALTVDLPLLGRIHEYTGTFRYRIEEDR